VGAALNITVCNCEHAEVIGLMDIQQPAYCNAKLKNQKPVIDKYEFYITEQPHTTWKGHLCMTWIKERRVIGYFFGGYNTIDSMSVQTISTAECRNLIETHDCDGNRMEETSPNLFSYKASPKTEGSWMQTNVDAIRNCVVQEITLKKDCIECPITSPFGVLTNSSNASSVITHDATIVWDLPTISEDEKCSLKRVHEGTGVVTQMDDESLKLIDETNQLEYHYRNETTKICAHTFHKLLTIDNAYIQFPDNLNKTWINLYSPYTKNCICQTTFQQTPCKTTEESQRFMMYRDLSIQPANEVKDKTCYGFKTQGLFRRLCDYQISSPGKLVWNPETNQITDGVQCLVAGKNLTLYPAKCEDYEDQVWLVGAPQHQTTNTEEEDQPLLAQHHQFVEDEAVERANILEREIKQVYCGNLQVRRYTTLMLAESNGLLAAMANNLPLCHRLKPNGKHLIVQRCTTRNITVTARETKCGHEPEYKNFTIGRDGYSLHPFQECFWKDGIVNLNGKSYIWNRETSKWSLEIPSYHLSTIKLTQQFKELEDNEYKYTFKHHKAFEDREFEQLNVMNELVTRIREENADSLSSLVLNTRAESRFWNIGAWSKSLKIIFLAAAGIIAALVTTYVISACCKLRIRQHQKDVTEFAVRLQEERMLHRRKSEESKI
jgi:hypothetical protein